MSATPGGSSITSFVLGSVCGALLCVLGVYSVKGKDVARPETGPPAWEPGPPATAAVVPVASESPAPEPPTPVGTNERRDLPAVDEGLLAPPVPIAKSPDVREAVTQAPPPEERKRTVFVGALQIDSTPQGAQVFVNRKPVGVTPLLITDLSAGSHAIRLEAEGHLPWSSAVRVVADRQTHVNTMLSPSPSSDPAD